MGILTPWGSAIGRRTTSTACAPFGKTSKRAGFASGTSPSKMTPPLMTLLGWAQKRFSEDQLRFLPHHGHAKRAAIAAPSKTMPTLFGQTPTCALPWKRRIKRALHARLAQWPDRGAGLAAATFIDSAGASPTNCAWRTPAPWMIFHSSLRVYAP